MPLQSSTPIRVYADTSVYGGAFDTEFNTHSALFFNQVRSGRFLLVSSALIHAELTNAPTSVRQLAQDLQPLIEDAPVTPDAIDLHLAYLKAGVVGQGSATDALHVAVATIARCPVLVSWNFKHIVHREKAPRYNAVNTLRNLPTIGIYSPAEVVSYEQGL
jgi:predicted nucleic acid-binding protein